MASASIDVDWRDHHIKVEVNLEEIYGGDGIVAGGPLAALDEAVLRARDSIGSARGEI